MKKKDLEYAIKKNVEEIAKLKRRLDGTMREAGFKEEKCEGTSYWEKPRFSVSEKANKILEYLKLEMIKTPGKVIPEKIIIKRIKTTPKKGRKK